MFLKNQPIKSRYQLESNMKKFFPLFIALTIILPTKALALEIDFPSIAGFKPGDSFGPADWIRYIFVFGLSLVGLAIIYTVIYAGIIWMIAGDNSGKISDAKKRLQDALIGLLILLGSYILLNTIDPNLVTLKQNIIQVDIGKSGGVLQLKQGGAVCHTDTECQSLQCTGGVCDMPPTIHTSGSVEVGGTCSSDGECKSGICKPPPLGGGTLGSGQGGYCSAW